MFDVPPPLLSRGLNAYTATWETFFAWQAKPVEFDFRDLAITERAAMWRSRPVIGRLRRL
jgi:ketosteroid isomerase-like protein